MMLPFLHCALPPGLQMKSIVNQGKLLPDALIIRVLTQAIQEASSSNNGNNGGGAPATAAAACSSSSLSSIQQQASSGGAGGSRGFILDGFPRTRTQADALLSSTPIDLALNMSLREEVLVEKCCGRRMCSKCGKNWNIANIYLPAGA
jgi:adenylate kinase family enzyme